MDETQVEARDHAAVWLWRLAAAATLASCVATACREPGQQPRRQSVVASRPASPWPTHVALAKRERWIPVDSSLAGPLQPPQLATLDNPRIDIEADLAATLSGVSASRIVRPVAGPLVERRPVGPVRADLDLCFDPWSISRGECVEKYGELLVMIPGEPQWRSGDLRVLPQGPGGPTLPSVSLATGRLLGALNTHAAKLPGWRLLAATLSPADEPAIVSSPPALRGPLLISPGDRLAMAPSRDANRAPRMTIRERELPRPEVSEAEPPRLNPFALLELIRALVDEEELAAWAIRAEEAVWKVIGAGAAAGATDALDDLSRSGHEMADRLTDAGLATRLRRACYALERRADAWRIAGELQAREATVVPQTELGDRRLRRRLAAVLSATGASGKAAAVETGDAWRRYLMTGELEQAITSPKSLGDLGRRQLAADLARRLSADFLTDEQRGFLASGPIAALGEELESWGGPPTDTTALLANLEAYESSRSPRLARAIARDARRLSDSSTTLHRNLATQIEQKYRNANLRMAVADTLLERYLPASPVRSEPVRDYIAGAFVQGRSTTRTDLSVRLLPDPHQWRLGLEARGEVCASTFANPGPVVLRNESTTNFLGRKLVLVRGDGVQVARAACDASSDTQLSDLSSYYDNVPILGGVIRSRAYDEHTQRRGVARQQSEQRVRERVQLSLDQQTDPMLASLEHRYNEAVLGRAASLGLVVDPIELRTTEQRLIARLRVANDRQLAAHTPRNRAPGDSVASVQVHESLMNNVADGLGLGGRRFTPAELRAYVRQRLRLPTPESEPAGDEEKAEFVLDDEEPVRVAFADGRAELILSIRELTVGESRFGAFKVHAFYRPQANGIEAMLARDGGVQIEARMRTGTRLKLHGVFSQALPEDQVIPLLKLPPQGEPRLEGFKVTQLVLDGGWLGLALGPEANEAGQRRVATVGRYVR